MKIQQIDISNHTITLDPPFPPAWDGKPRHSFTATIVTVTTDEGLVGIGSGDKMYGFCDYAYLFLGQDPLEIQRHYRILENISFHAGRPWPLDIALWDLIGKIKQKPVYKLLGNHCNKLQTYASSGVLRTPQETAQVAQNFLKIGFKAMKLRFARNNTEEDLERIKAIRKQLGQQIEIMVDINQGWRMPWDTDPPWSQAKAIAVAKELEKLNVYWMEEPLHRGDYEAMTNLNSQVQIKIAGGEMTRESYEFKELIERGCFDVLQPDATLTLGITGLREIAAQAKYYGLIFTPHTWGNGIGLLANAHLTAGTTGTDYLEFPFDPPEWTCERRDFMLQNPIEIDKDGWLHLPDTPGLGIELNKAILQKTLESKVCYK